MRSESSDVLVVGAGPAGVAAALEAARCGRRVLMVDDNASPGGQIWRGGGSSAPPRARRLFEELEGAGVRRLGATTIVDARGPHRFVAHSEPSGETFDLCTDRVVLATGSRELFLPFPGWTLPGVHGAGGLQALAKGGWPVAGRRVVIAGSGPLLLAVAAYLRGAGAKVVAIVEQARMASLVGVAHALVAQPAKAWQALTLGAGLAGITKWYGAWPLRAEGETRLQRVVISRRGKEVALDCDLLACAFGLVANSEVAAFLGCQQREGATCVDELQRTSVDGVLAAGEATGIGGVDVALVEGRIAGCVAAGDEQRARALLPHAHAQRRFAARLNRAFELRSELRELATDDTVVCRCEDVRWGEVAPFDDARDAKLQTRCGMGPCQGRVCGPALRFVHGWGPDRIRPPFYPVPMAVLAEAGGAQRPGETP